MFPLDSNFVMHVSSICSVFSFLCKEVTFFRLTDLISAVIVHVKLAFTEYVHKASAL